MDGRKYDAVKHVSPGQFDKDQRQRLEAVTAAVALRGDSSVTEQLAMADFIATGLRDRNVITGPGYTVSTNTNRWT